ncbi:MAG: hypothetical protein LIO51_06695 [Clostridiales bacterium]|nr:hypothetical protein [Clostridiales bacterium]
MNIGIDFGSTYSTVSAYNSVTGQVEALTLVEGEPASIPSVVSISKKGKVTCGKGAKDQAGKRTVRIFEAFKMLLTETNGAMLRRRGYDDRNTPRYITRRFLESTLRGILSRYDDGKGLENVFICVPEIWGKNLQTLDGRVILRDILKNELSIPVGHVQVVTEPEAASAFYAYHYEQETGRSFNGHLLLIDYGGGTLDITLTEVSSDGQGTMEIGYREGGGAGENHPDSRGECAIGNAGIAYIQSVVVCAMREQGVLGEDEIPAYTSPDFIAAVRDLESQLKTADRIREIEDVFGVYGSGYQELEEVLNDNPIEFCTLEYDGEEIPVTYQQLYTAYRDTIAGVLAEQIRQINEKVKAHINADPCDPASGVRDDFKIAMVGGFGLFYLVKKQISEIYRLDANEKIDRRTKNIAADKREQAISLGAALLAAGKVTLQKTARYSIGLYTAGSDRVYRLHYGIKYHQIVEPGKPYFICNRDSEPDEPKNRITYGALYGNITHFAIEFTDRRNSGGLMALKPDILKRLEKLPEEGFWNCGFSMDESDIVTFHIVPRPLLPGEEAPGEEIAIPLDSYTKMFDLTAVTEVTT